MKAWTILIIGATGDLSRKRLIPALFEMSMHTNEPSFIFMGAAKEQTTIDQLLDDALTQAKSESFHKFAVKSSYQAIDFENPSTFTTLANSLEEHERRFSLSGTNRLVYLAIDSQWYARVTQLLCNVGILKKLSTHRVIYEKPFGWDLQSAQQINREITKHLQSQQIYRIDHYMSNALVTSLLTTRISNIFFEPIWNKSSIEQVQIVLSEEDTIQNRGTFYDQYGALKDVVQNHMLQLLACISMEKPPSFEHKTVSLYKQEVLRHIHITAGLLGQYAGYTELPGVDKNSQRETYALLKAEVDTPRWRGVPFFLKTGKALNCKSTEIHLLFKPQKSLMGSAPCNPNRLIFRLSPSSATTLILNAQKNRAAEIAPHPVELSFRCNFGMQPHFHETLFYEAMHGDSSSTISFEEIAYSWQIIAQLEKLTLPLYRYTPGSTGPEEADTFSILHNIAWYTSSKG